MRKLTIDFETRSCAVLRTCGSAAYAMHPSTEVLCLALKWQDADPVIWFSEPFRYPTILPTVSDEDIVRMVGEADVIEAHNASFEFNIWKYCFSKKYGFPMLPVNKLQCSLVKCAYYSLPRDLKTACEVTGVSQQKDQEGSRLMQKLCKPRRPRKDEDPDGIYWYGTPEDYIRLGEYCMQDVRSEEALSNALPNISDYEQKLWHADLYINDSGIRVDVPAINAITSILDRHAGMLTDEFQNLTQLESVGQRNKVLDILNALGSDMEGLRKDDVSRALGTVKNATAKRILQIRSSLSKSSTKKYEAFMNTKCPDDRIRGTLQFYGTSTGRWAGRLIQPQNFPRGTVADPDMCIRAFESGSMDMVTMLYGDPMEAASGCIRGMIVPSEGNDFVCADFSSIEGRTLAWLAEETSALDVYREGRDPYKVAASAIYGVPYDSVDKKQRQIGKVAELALGYQGGVKAFAAMGSGYGVVVPDEQAELIKTQWRESRPMTVRLWKELETCALLAMDRPGKAYRYGKTAFVRTGRFLRMLLPSGRSLYYFDPKVVEEEMTWGTKRRIDYMGIDGTSRKWTTQKLYGGLLAENLTQAVARDLLANAIRNALKHQYHVVFHVHDEIIAEVPEGYGSVEEFEAIMCETPEWADGLPLKAEGWRGKRYKK